MALTTTAQVLDARLVGQDAMFNGVSINSRSLQQDNLFVALHGPNFDGHDYIAAAQHEGAVAAVVQREVATDLPLLKVVDTQLALTQLAKHWRREFSIPVIAVTGSNGKTTVKEMIAAILAQQGPVLATQGNLNNEIGVPLTLLRLATEHRAAVVEMGANHAGEIAALTKVAEPTIALINNVAAAHLEGFGSLDGVALAKGEIFSGLSEQGIAVINADDVYAQQWRDLATDYQQIDFALDRDADVSAQWTSSGNGCVLNLQTPLGCTEIVLSLSGKHNVMNALAATAVSIAAGVSLENVRQGLQGFAGVPHRQELKVRDDGLIVIDDTYNANPASLQAGLDVLAQRPGQHYLILGDMGELGKNTAELHRLAGVQARSMGVDYLYALGEMAQYAAAGFGDGGRGFDSQDTLLDALQVLDAANTTVLVKGSRCMNMERIVDGLMQSQGGVAC
ncbi:MAG: UDP-N-acetylmuramoyl-tripeptide--D-alanyl-D-alanine ligase [Gammaproteobacteria bacterium]|nr:UDP-N-acetylmuramoyl-tripeptide--D-alanyl-D-alanine ligase [Gammaproteobacteria bacterium]